MDEADGNYISGTQRQLVLRMENLVLEDVLYKNSACHILIKMSALLTLPRDLVHQEAFCGNVPKSKVSVAQPFGEVEHPYEGL